MVHAEALRVAERMVEIFRPGCRRVEIAGSVRRGKAEPRDIEIVAMPDIGPVMRGRAEFGKPAPPLYRTKLDQIVGELCDGERAYLRAGGDKYKKIYLIEERIQVDLFVVTPPAQWGVIYTIRTGPSGFSHWCVTRRASRGGLPDAYIVEGGAVGKRVNGRRGGVIEMREELDFLEFLGVGWIEPGERGVRWGEVEKLKQDGQDG